MSIRTPNKKSLNLDATLKACNVRIVDVASKMQVNRVTVAYYINQGDLNPLAQLKRIATAANIPLSRILKEYIKKADAEIADANEVKPMTDLFQQSIVCPHCNKPIRIE
jgi:transcriptional regulator with XRE-family HTH domain